MLQAVAFWMFAGVLSASALMVIAARNPVHSVLFLIVSFFSAAGLFVLMGAEFLAMILIVVYVGAVAVLFLFVVMMLDVDFAAMRQGFLRYLPVGLIVGAILMALLVMTVTVWTVAPNAQSALAARTPEAIGNTEALGRILYTDYVFAFQLSGLVLLVAMVGAIVLTLRERAGVRRQSAAAQIARDPAAAVELKKVKPGQGI